MDKCKSSANELHRWGLMDKRVDGVGGEDGGGGGGGGGVGGRKPV